MHPLELVLQLQVGSDQTAVLSLPSILSALTPSHFEPSSHLQKWISRVTSLIHSKHPGARWAGLCLALQTSFYNKDVMVEASQSWIAVTLPMLSKNETPPTWKACIRLLVFIFSSTIGIPEFQRQMTTPNVPKFSAALLSLAEKSEDHEIRHVSMAALTHLVPLFPTLHRQLHNSMFNMSLRYLSGSSTSPTPYRIMEDACDLHAVLHFTGGKVGAAPLWRKSLDTALANAWSALKALRTTFVQLPHSNSNVSPTFDFFPSDPAIAVPLSLDRLRCSIALITQLLRAVTSRPVPVPIGELNMLALCLLQCTLDEKEEVHFDTTRRALEISVIPEIWRIGCTYVPQLMKSLRYHLNPHASRILSYVAHHLEQPIPKSHRITFLRILPSLLSCNLALHSPILPTRLAKSLLTILTTLLPQKSVAQQQLEETFMATSRKGKKRTRGYEGDEVFKVGVSVLCSTSEDCELVETALEALDPLLSNPHLSAPVRTLSGRLLISLLLEVPRQSPSAISHDLSFHGRLYARLLALCNRHVVAGSSGWVNSAVGLVVNATCEAMDGNELVLKAATESQYELDILIHPRLPPLLRSHPPVEALSLFKSGSAENDQAAQDSVGLYTTDAATPRETTTEVMTVQQIDTQPSTTSAQEQSWTMRNTSSALALAPVPTVAAPISAPPITTDLSAIPRERTPSLSIKNTANEAETPSVVRLGDPDIPQQNIASASTHGMTLGLPNDQDSDSDEEMPEIDTRSDSD